MTIIMGLKIADGVIFTGDMKRNDITPNGQNIGSYNESKKVYQIHPRMIIATAGLGGLGESTVNLLQSVIGINESISVSDALKIVKDTFAYNHKLFRDVNPNVEYLDLVAFIGGYDSDKEEPYMYTINAIDNFELKLCENDSFIRVGSDKDITTILDRKVNAEISSCKNFLDVITIFSSAIRDVNSDDVSKETFSICSFYHKAEGYKTSSIFIDENGEIK